MVSVSFASGGRKRADLAMVPPFSGDATERLKELEENCSTGSEGGVMRQGGRPSERVPATIPEAGGRATGVRCGFSARRDGPSIRTCRRGQSPGRFWLDTEARIPEVVFVNPRLVVKALSHVGRDPA
jgi:hypothetical protein